MPPWLIHVRPPSPERNTSMWLSEEPSDSPTCWAAISVSSASGVITGMKAPRPALREMMPAAMISILGAMAHGSPPRGSSPNGATYTVPDMSTRKHATRPIAATVAT